MTLSHSISHRFPKNLIPLSPPGPAENQSQDKKRQDSPLKHTKSDQGALDTPVISAIPPMQRRSRTCPSRQPENPRQDFDRQRDNRSRESLDEAGGDERERDDDDDGPEGDEDVVVPVG